MSTRDITLKACCIENQMADIDVLNGIYMSCCFLYRGHINCMEATEAIAYHKSLESVQWVDWSPSGYKVNILFILNL